MSDVDEKRLAVAVRHFVEPRCADYEQRAKLLLRDIDAHDAAEARAGITDELVEGAAKVAWERSAGSWAHAPNVARDPYRADIRAALEAVAPLLARRAPIPEVVTTDMRDAAICAFYDGSCTDHDAGRLHRAIEAALAAAPRDPQPAEPVSISVTDKCEPCVTPEPLAAVVGRLTRRVEALEAAAQGRAYIAPRGAK